MAQLTTAQQKVAELTPLAKEAVDLWTWVIEACQDTEDAEKAFEALSMRIRRDDEATAKVKKERDELLQKEASNRQCILDLLGEVEVERDLKLRAKEKVVALEKKASKDASTVERLHKERDKLIQTMERLCSEHGATQQKASSLRKLEAESVSVGLAVDLTEVQRNLQAESDELEILKATLRVVCDDLEVVQSEGTSSLMAHAMDIMAQVR
ncbi:uncharacterized protein [Miscanthus floridulus]|uniref:uncharacterized protein n=1 Tax=Miscanthus floridulus TaxID=154761 RepID=UPI003459B339